MEGGEDMGYFYGLKKLISLIPPPLKQWRVAKASDTSFNEKLRSHLFPRLFGL
jgi:hypothetical protein